MSTQEMLLVAVACVALLVLNAVLLRRLLDNLKGLFGAMIRDALEDSRK